MNNEPETGKTILSSQIVYQNTALKLRVRYEYGEYFIESGASKGPVQRLKVAPEAMDLLVKAWPEWRKTVKI